MKPYSKYKASGVEWIGDIPESWTVKPLKYLGKIISGSSFKSDEFIENGECRVMKISNIQTMRIDWTDESFLPINFYEQYSNFQIKRGDLVFALTRPIISTGIKAAIVDCDDKILLNQRNAVLKPSQLLDVNWMYYIIFNSRFIDYFDMLIDKTGQQPNISSVDIANISIPLPTSKEQLEIINYLKSKTTELDTLIANKKSLIELLKEERTAIINHAITKGISGLNHDSLDLLDSKDYENQENQSNPKNHGSDNVRYKDSGIEWIGEIPEHWEVKRLRYLAKICNGQDQKAVLDEDGKYPIYGSGGIFGRANTFLYDKPSVLLGRKGTIDKPRLVIEPFWSVDTAFYTKIFDNVSVMYFYYLCCSINFDLYKYGSAVPSMTQGYLNEIKFSIPKLEEQNDIVKFIETKTTEIDTIISQTEKEIDLLKEYKTALISEVVLGKVDVSSLNHDLLD